VKIESGNASVFSGKTRATLLARLQDGADLLAWDEFFQRYWRLIYAYARRCNCSDHTAEEVVQDVMLKIFELKDFFHYDPDRGRFRDWLCTVVRNKVFELRRKSPQCLKAVGGDSIERMEPRSPQAQPNDVWEDAFEQALLLVLLDVVRREMTPRAYLAFEFFTLHGMSGAKTAKLTGLTRNGVYRAHKKALQRLKELGAGYREDGRLCEKIKQALQSRPQAAIEQSITTRVVKAFSSPPTYDMK
jgi:RNA polymerase sigma factor (sigma-70 family)